MKLGVNALLLDQHTRKQWPNTSGWTLARFRRALVERHPVIAECIGRGLGFHLMHTESEIMTRVLTALSSDLTLVRRLHASKGNAAMEEVSREMTSYILPVTCSF